MPNLNESIEILEKVYCVNLKWAVSFAEEILCKPNLKYKDDLFMGWDKVGYLQEIGQHIAKRNLENIKLEKILSYVAEPKLTLEQQLREGNSAGLVKSRDEVFRLKGFREGVRTAMSDLVFPVAAYEASEVFHTYVKNLNLRYEKSESGLPTYASVFAKSIEKSNETLRLEKEYAESKKRLTAANQTEGKEFNVESW